MKVPQNTDTPEYEVVWEPLPGSQTFAFNSPCDETLYEGARGPGKTAVQIMAFVKNVGKGYGKFWRGVIFDLEFDHLGGIVTESKKWIPKFEDGAKFLESPMAYKWVWPTGEELLFRHVKKISDYEGFHGHEYPFIGWNELTKHPTDKLYEKFKSVNRNSFEPEKDTPHEVVSEANRDERSFLGNDGVWRNYLTPNRLPLPPIPMSVFSTTNPSGPGHNWVKKYFIDVAPRGTVYRESSEIIDPLTREKVIATRTRIAIFGSYIENKYLPQSYIAYLSSIQNPNIRKAWLEGDWDVTAGGAIDDLWRHDIHVIDRFPIPKTWTVDRSYDDGSTHPFSVGWWAEADGTEAKYTTVTGEVKTFCPPKGSIIQICELYGAKEIGSNEGLKWGIKRLSEEINSIETSLMLARWIVKKPAPGPADNRIRQVIDSDTDSTEKVMLRYGIAWTKSDKSPGSRANGLKLLRERLENSLNGEGPGLYFMRNCKASIETIPVLQYDPDKVDDVDTTSEDHAYDMVRYRVLKTGNRNLKIIKNSIKMVS